MQKAGLTETLTEVEPDRGFTTPVIMSLLSEMAQLSEAAERVGLLVSALAKEHGVKIAA